MDASTCYSWGEVLSPKVCGLPFYSYTRVRYEIGEQYKPHTDYFKNSKSLGTKGNRIATVLTYLESPEEGGETYFPTINLKVKPEKVSDVTHDEEIVNGLAC